MVFGQLVMYANVAGASKKVVVFGVSYIGYTAGNLIGELHFVVSPFLTMLTPNRPSVIPLL